MLMLSKYSDKILFFQQVFRSYLSKSNANKRLAVKSNVLRFCNLKVYSNNSNVFLNYETCTVNEEAVI